MASINIGQENSGDTFYRYKMPRLQAVVGSLAACTILCTMLVEPSCSVVPDHSSYHDRLCGCRSKAVEMGSKLGKHG